MKRTTPAPSAGAKKLPAGFHRTPDWSILRPGDRIIIRSSDDVTVAGQVDALTSDGSLMWVVPDGGPARKMYYFIDNEEIWSARQPGS
jgi:hypothetical protein